MAPRLLDKRVLSTELATQKKQQIDQGITLAKKVDAVRETLGEEEKNLESFRTQSIQRVQQEIDSKVKERDELSGEISIRKEWLSIQDTELEKRKNILDKREQYVNERFQLLESIINELD